MTARETAPLIAAAARHFAHLLGRVKAEDLLALITIELGHEEALDRFCIQHSNARTAPPGDVFTQYSRAVAPGVILHLFDDHDPVGALHSLMRGLLIGAHNLVRLPSSGLDEVTAFRDVLHPDLANEIEISRSVPARWMEDADAVIAHGDDEFLRKTRGTVRHDQIFIGRMRRIAYALIFEDSLYESTGLLAADISRHDQLAPGCPHVVYVGESGHLDPRSYARQLASAMQDYEKRHPRRELLDAEDALITNLRTSYRLKAEREPKAFGLWESPGSTAWTVIFESDPLFSVSCLNRVVFVKPLPPSLTPALASVRGRIGTVGIYPTDIAYAHTLAKFSFPRICPVGKMNTPPPTWHHNGGQGISPLVRWIDFDQPPR